MSAANPVPGRAVVALERGPFVRSMLLNNAGRLRGPLYLVDSLTQAAGCVKAQSPMVVFLSRKATLADDPAHLPRLAEALASCKPRVVALVTRDEVREVGRDPWPFAVTHHLVTPFAAEEFQALASCSEQVHRWQSAPADAQDPLRRHRLMALDLERASHTEVLGVAPGAGMAEVQAAYLAIVRLFHPDAVGLRGDGALRHTTEAIYRRATTAWRALALAKTV